MTVDVTDAESLRQTLYASMSQPMPLRAWLASTLAISRDHPESAEADRSQARPLRRGFRGAGACAPRGELGITRAGPRCWGVLATSE
jgi:hypothetical protein